MPLTAGTRIGQYDILAPLGSGGMGDVYRARDTKLNRDVAIKVVPERLAHDQQALARFEREAQAVAALSHPNILAIHDFGRAIPVPPSSRSGDTGAAAVSGPITYAVTELLEGETLRAWLANGALPARKAVEFGLQTVRGIAAAHERGVVHRDLKPENIFITKDGVLKILDFGLAKASGTAAALGTAIETKLAAETVPGTVMGTVGYMSPEQVRGQDVDHRTDIFAFGAILYELLTGRRAFRGDSHVETMNAILKEDPPEFSEINPNLPSALDRLIRRCLEKQPNDRFHSAHDLAIALEAVSGTSTQSAATAAAAARAAEPARRAQPRVPLLAAGVLIVLIGAATFVAGRMSSDGAEKPAADFVRLTYRRGKISSARIAPGGTNFIYAATWEGTPLQLYSTRSESPESQAMPYANADVVSVSSKGELAIVSNRVLFRAFAQTGTLARAPLAGGASRDVLEGVQDADWLPDGSDLAVSHVVDGKFRLEFPIGKVVYETTGWISHVRVSRDGQRVAFLDQPILGDDRGSPAIIDASGKKQTIPVDCESTQGLAWVPSGDEIWFTCASKGLWRALLASTPGGKVRTVLQVPGSLFLADIGADGSVLLSHDNARRGMVALAPGETKERDISWLDWSQPAALSEDGRTLLFTEEGEGGGPGYGAFLRKTDGSPAIRLGTGETMAISPDGRWAIVQKLDPSPAQFMLIPTGAGQSRALTSDDVTHVAARFLPDGKRFLFAGFKPGRASRVWSQSLGGGAPEPVTPEGYTLGPVAPDGTKFVARELQGQAKLFALGSNAAGPEPIRSLQPGDAIARFTADGRSVLIRRQAGNGAALVLRMDLATGTRTPVRTITPPSEVVGVGQLHITADGSAYVYGYGVTHSDLFLVKGLR